MALSLSFITVSPALASPVHGLNVPIQAFVGNTAKVKTVSFTVRNNTASSVTIQAGDQQYTLAPGKESKVKVAQGTQLTTVSATGAHAAGDVPGTADSTLGGNTLVIN